jgi:hypothetical protein
VSGHGLCFGTKPDLGGGVATDDVGWSEVIEHFNSDRPNVVGVDLTRIAWR